MNKKTAFLVYRLNAGGYQNYLLRFLKNTSLQSKYVIISKSPYRGDLTDQFEALKVPIYYQSFSALNPLKWLFFFKFLRKYGFTTICDFSGNFGGIAMMLGKWSGIKQRIVFYRRSSNAFKPNNLKKIYNKCLNRFVDTYATKILANSFHALDFFHPHHRKKPEKFKVIYNGLDVKNFEVAKSQSDVRDQMNISQNAFIIGHVGRFDEAKNHETIFQVAKELVQRESNVCFAFCGRQTDSEAFKERINFYELQDHVFLLGIRENIPEVLKAFDLFYFPSVTESQPNALIEAMLASLPVVTSNIPPIKEAIPQENHHLLLDPYDVEQAVSQLNYLKNNPESRENYQQKQWAAKTFDVQKNFKAFETEL